MDSPAATAAVSLLSGRKESMPVPDAAKITVAIRVRPLTEEEERMERVMSQGVVVDGTQVQVNGKDGRSQRTFAFDHCFDSTFVGSKTGSQEHLFETIGRKVLTDAWEGFNTCVFAYGQTGSGKTHTMLGGDKPGEEGLLPRIGRELLKSIEDAKYQNSRKKASGMRGRDGKVPATTNAAVEGNADSRTSYGGYRSGDDEEDDASSSGGSSDSSMSSSSTSSSSYAKEGSEEGKEEEEEDFVQFELKASYVELYNEKFYDLLSKAPTNSESLKLREDPKKGAFLKGATWETVGDWAEMQSVMERGKAARRTATTKMNEMSSRSHAIFMLEFRQMTNNRSLLPQTSSTSSSALEENAAVARVSQICLVDLAGSERRDKSGIVDPVRAREGSQINLSLVHLGKVLNSLANQSMSGTGGKENSSSSSSSGSSRFMGESPARTPSKVKAAERGEFVNYRESKLTMLLRESLGGNAKTIMLATVAPSHAQMNETVNTLGYANNAKNIFTRPHVNEDPRNRVIRQLLEEMNVLRTQLAAKKGEEDMFLPAQANPLTSVMSKEEEGEEGIRAGNAAREGRVRMCNERTGTPQRSPIMLKVDGKEQDEVVVPAQEQEQGGEEVHTPWLDEESARQNMEDDELAPSTSLSLAGGPNGRMRSKSAASDKQPGGGSSAATAGGMGGHARKPSEINNRLPRLAKAVVTQGVGLPAPAAGFLRSSANNTRNKATTTTSTKRFITPDDSPAIPETTAAAEAAAETTTKIHTLSMDSAIPETNPKPSYYNITYMSLSDVQDMKKRFLNIEHEITSQAIKNLTNEGDASMLSEKVLTVLPLVIEANSLAQSSNKPTSFYLDIFPRPPSTTHPVLRLEETLSSTGHGALAEAMGLQHLSSLSTPALLPALLETADMVPTVVVRARGALNDSICDMSIEEFKEALIGMKAARARPEGRMPLLEGGGHRQHRHADSLDSDSGARGGGLGGSLGSAISAEDDAFHFKGQDSLLGRSEVYLSALLDNRNVLGCFPLLSGMDGACIGTVKLRLVPLNELSSTPTLGTDKSYTLKLDLESLDVEKQHLGQLGLGGAWNSNPAFPGNPALRYPDENGPGLVLRYGFWPSETCGEVELSMNSSRVREMFSRATTETVCYPIAHQATLHVENITPSFLTYLATGALRLTLHITSDPSEAELWSRHQGLPQLPTVRCDALSQVHSMDSPEDLESVMIGEGGGGGGGGRLRSMNIDIPEQEVEEGDMFSVMGSLAPPGAFDTCSAINMRMNGKMSVRRSQSTRHAAHFYSEQHPDTACFLYMGVDLLEPILEPGIDYFSDLPTKFVPVDIKPLSFRRRYLGGGKRGGKGGIERRTEAVGVVGFNPVSLLMNRSSSGSRRRAASGFGSGLEMEDDNVSEMGDCWDGSDLGSVVSNATAATAWDGGPSAPNLDRMSGADAVFHVMANPLIRIRQMRIVIEQVSKAGGGGIMLLESVLHVRVSKYESSEVRLWTGEFEKDNVVAIPLDIVRVERSVCKKRLEVIVDLPGAENMYETCGRGGRVYLGVEVAVFVEGAAQPVIIPRTVVMKVLPPKRHEGMMYTLKKKVVEPMSDRLHRIGTYYAVKISKGAHLRETVSDFIQYKLEAHQELLKRMEKARMLQEGEGKEGVLGAEMVKGQPDLTFESWKAALHRKGGGIKNNYHHHQTNSKLNLEGVARRMRNLDLGEDEDEVEMEEETNEEDVVFTGHRTRRQHLSTMAMNVEERKAVASALFGVDLTVERANGKGAVPVRAPNGVYYMEKIPAPEGRPVSYLYPARGMGDQLMREQVRQWQALSPMWVVDVPDFPTTREGFLSMRTGLLGATISRLWFVWRRPFLFIYKSKPPADSKAYHAPVDVVNVTDCDVILAEKNEDELGFVIKGTTKKWHLQAANEDDLTSWLVALGQPVKNLPPGGSQELMMLMNCSSSSSSSSVVSGMMPPRLGYRGRASTLASTASVGSVSTRGSHFQQQQQQGGVYAGHGAYGGDGAKKSRTRNNGLVLSPMGPQTFDASHSGTAQHLRGPGRGMPYR